MASRAIDGRQNAARLLIRPSWRNKAIGIVLGEVLGWEPKVELRTGLEKTICYFDGLLKGDLPHLIAAARG